MVQEGGKRREHGKSRPRVAKAGSHASMAPAMLPVATVTLTLRQHQGVARRKPAVTASTACSAITSWH